MTGDWKPVASNNVSKAIFSKSGILHELYANEQLKSMDEIVFRKVSA